MTTSNSSNEEIKYPIWYKLKTSENIFFPSTKDEIYYLTKKDNNIKNKIYISKNYKSNFEITNYQHFNFNDEIKKINKNYNKNYMKIVNDSKNDDKKKNTKIKTLNTKLRKELDKMNTVTRADKYIINFSDKQKDLLKEWIPELKRVYNFCVDKHNIDNKYFNNGFKGVKSDIFKELYQDNKPVPYDVLTDEIRVFYSNLKSCYTNLKNKNINHFTINKKIKEKTNYSLLIPSKSISKNGIFHTIIGKINNFNIGELPSSDCRLFYNLRDNSFTLSVPRNRECKKVSDRNPIVAIDPGEKKFIGFYGLESYGYIGKNIGKVLIGIRKRNDKLKKILSKKINKSGKKIRNKKHLKNKIRKNYKRISNIVTELHNQSANFLCKSYDRILIPKFETQSMIKCTKKPWKEEKQKVMSEGITPIEKSIKGKEFIKKSRLNKNVKYVLNQLSHYKFRQHLANKCKEYGCQLKVVSEEYTSLSCTKCGFISKNFVKRIKKCTQCNFEIDRDTNGARNILIKNILAKNEIRLKAEGDLHTA